MADFQFESDAARAAAEQQALANTLTSTQDTLGAGANVPQVLDQNPATRQLLEEAIAIQTGQKSKAIQGSQDFIASQNQDVVTSGPAQNQFDQNLSRLDQLEAQSQQDVNGTLGQLGATAASGVPQFAEPDDTATQDLIERQRSLIRGNLDAQIQNIQNQFVSRRREQEGVNRGRQGATQALVARTGSSTFASGQGAITSEMQRGQDAINELTALEQQAINSARQAAAGNDIALLEKSIASAEAARQAKNDIRQQTFQNLITSQEAARSQTTFDRESATGQLDLIGQLFPNMNPEQLAQLDPAIFSNLESELNLPTGTLQDSIRLQAEEQEKAAIVDQFNTITKLGATGTITPEQLTEFAAALNIPDSALQGVVDAANSPTTELKSVGGDLIGITTNPDGTWDVSLVHSGGGGSSSSSSGPRSSSPTGQDSKFGTLAQILASSILKEGTTTNANELIQDFGIRDADEIEQILGEAMAIVNYEKSIAQFGAEGAVAGAEAPATSAFSAVPDAGFAAPPDATLEDMIQTLPITDQGTNTASF